MADKLQEDTLAGANDSEPQANNNFNQEDSESRYSEEKKTDIASIWKDKYLHLLADLENTKKRNARSYAQEAEGQKEELLIDVLQIADGLDLALIHISSEEDGRKILQGIELLREILDKFFIKYDVKMIAAFGEVFDPNFHEAIGMVQHPSAAANAVVRVERKGYLYHEKLLRPSQVLVSAG